MKPMSIVIIEDNENVRESVKAYLELEGMVVADFAGLAEGQDFLLNNKVDLLVLDVMLPDGDGFLFAKKLRQRTDIPIIFLSARVSESDRITGLELGADDYLTKPFSPKELVLRVKALLKRTAAAVPEAVDHKEYHYSGDILVIDNEQHRSFLNDTALVFTAGEWNILNYLAGRSGQVFNRMQILENCLESMAEGSERTIDTHIKNIRHKLGNPDWIETVRGYGYRFSGREKG